MGGRRKDEGGRGERRGKGTIMKKRGRGGWRKGNKYEWEREEGGRV